MLMYKKKKKKKKTKDLIINNTIKIKIVLLINTNIIKNIN